LARVSAIATIIAHGSVRFTSTAGSLGGGNGSHGDSVIGADGVRD
jgi:hypothetical protein